MKRLEKIATLIHGLVSDEKNDLGDIASCDSEITSLSDDGIGDDAYCFSLYEHIDRPNPNYSRLHKTIPVGHFEYKITITKQWIPFEEDEPEPK